MKAIKKETPAGEPAPQQCQKRGDTLGSPDFTREGNVKSGKGSLKQSRSDHLARLSDQHDSVSCQHDGHRTSAIALKDGSHLFLRHGNTYLLQRG